MAMPTTLKDQVIYLLERFPETRNNDLALIFKWLQLFGGVYVPLLKPEKLKELGSKPESIIRLRRRLQNDLGRYREFSDPSLARKRRQTSKSLQ